MCAVWDATVPKLHPAPSETEKLSNGEFSNTRLCPEIGYLVKLHVN